MITTIYQLKGFSVSVKERCMLMWDKKLALEEKERKIITLLLDFSCCLARQSIPLRGSGDMPTVTSDKSQLLWRSGYLILNTGQVLHRLYPTKSHISEVEE